MSTARNGNYPAPPFWPERLTHPGKHFSVHVWLDQAIQETDSVAQVYIMDGYPGPCSMTYYGDQFHNWMPAVTIERAERYGERA